MALYWRNRGDFPDSGSPPMFIYGFCARKLIEPLTSFVLIRIVQVPDVPVAVVNVPFAASDAVYTCWPAASRIVNVADPEVIWLA